MDSAPLTFAPHTEKEQGPKVPLLFFCVFLLVGVVLGVPNLLFGSDGQKKQVGLPYILSYFLLFLKKASKKSSWRWLGTRSRWKPSRITITVGFPCS